MSLFKNRLEARLRSLEHALGFEYVNTDYPKHILGEDGYSMLNNIKRSIKELQNDKSKRGTK